MAEPSPSSDADDALAGFREAFDRALAACDTLLLSELGLITHLRQAGMIDDPQATALLAEADQIEAAIRGTRAGKPDIWADLPCRADT